MNRDIMNKHPKISIILPSYNHERFIRKAILSILNQTYEDFELIISDDASTDRTYEIIKEFKDKRIHRHVFKENQKVGNFRYCLNHAHGDYIAVAHSDDFWAPDKLKKQMDYLENNPDTGAVFTLADLVDDNGYIIEDGNPFRAFNGSQGEWLRKFFYEFNFLCHPSILCKKSLYNTLFQRSFKGYLQFGDLSAWIPLVKQAPIYLLCEPLVHFSWHGDMSNQSAPTYNNMIRAKNEQYFILREFFDNMPDNLFVEGFGAFLRKQNPTRDEIKCEQAFLYLGNIKHTGMLPVYRQIGLEKINSLMQNRRMRNVLKNSYNFTEKEYRFLTGSFYAFADYHQMCYEKMLLSKRFVLSKNTAIYGTGSLTEEILKFTEKKPPQICQKFKCVIENDKKKHGEVFEVLPVVSIEQALHEYQIDTIVIASKSYQDVIYERIKSYENAGINIIKIFEDITPQ